MTIFIVPLENDPNKKFNVDLDGNTYEMDIHWNVADNAWYMHLTGITNTVTINGVKLATGQNLLKPYSELDLGAIYMVDETELERDADFDTIGVDVKMYYVTKDDVDSII